MLAGAGDSNMVSPPEVVAATIALALRARRPRTRYATGGGAKTILALRRFMSDRGFAHDGTTDRRQGRVGGRGQDLIRAARRRLSPYSAGGRPADSRRSSAGTRG